MVTLLRALYLDPRVGPELLQSLSVGGVDGTTRNRFKGTLAAARVRAKTGTLNAKSCLSGLVGDGNDCSCSRSWSRASLPEPARRRAAPRSAAVNAMMRYVYEGTGARIDLPVPDESRVGTDYETGSEVQGEESETPEPAAGETQPPPLSAAPGEDPAEAQQRRDRDRQRQLAPGAAAAPPTPGVSGPGAPPSKPGAPVVAPPRAPQPRPRARPPAPGHRVADSGGAGLGYFAGAGGDDDGGGRRG